MAKQTEKTKSKQRKATTKRASKKAPAKKAPPKKAPAKKAPAKKAPTKKKAPPKEAAPKKAPAKKKAPTKKAPPKKAPPKKAPPKKKAAPKKAPPKKAPPRKAPAKKAPTKKAAEVVRPAWPQLNTRVIFGRREAEAWALGVDISDLYGLRLQGATEVLLFPVNEVYDCWSSSNGATYFATRSADPIFTHHEGTWTKVPVEPDGGKPIPRISHIRGIDGATPAEDELFCIAYPDVVNEAPCCALYRRRAGAWRAIPLRAGLPWALTIGDRGEVYLSLGPTLPPDREPPLLLRFSDGELEALDLPVDPNETKGATGLCALPDGKLLACFSAPEEGPARAYLRDATGSWSDVEAPIPFDGWAVGQIDCQRWQGRTFLATNQGVLELDASGRLIQGSNFRAVSLWPLEDALVCRGWREGTYAHEILRGERWEPYLIPNPEVVTGGLGKVVSLPGRRKVPVVKVRLPPTRPAPAAVTAKAAVMGAERFYETVFDRLGERDGVAVREQRLDAAGQIEAQYGCTPTPGLASYLDFYGGHQLAAQYGQIALWSETYFPLPGPCASSVELADSIYRTAPAIIAALTNTIYLGADGGGQIYFAQVDPDRSEVFLYGPGVGELKFLADSLTSFFYLNEMDERWEAFSAEHGVDIDDVDTGEVDPASLDIPHIREGLRELAQRVNLSGFDESDISSDFDEVLPLVTGIRPLAAPQSPTLRLFDGARWLIFLLAGIYVEVGPAAARRFEEEMADPILGKLAATKAYWLWHLYLFGRREELERLIADSSGDDARLVRDTARLMDELLHSPDLPGEIGHLRQLPAVVQQARGAAAGERVDTDSLLRPDGKDSKRVRGLKQQLTDSRTNTNVWDQLLYAYYEEQRYQEMLDATSGRLSIAADAYYPWLQRGIALHAMRRYREALDAYDRALALDHVNADTWLNKSGIYAVLGDWSNALTHLRKAVQYNPQYKVLAKSDEDFKAVWEDPEFRSIVG